MKTKIELSDYPKLEAFKFFSKMSYPFYAVSFNQDVTKLYNYVKKRGLSFYCSLVYLCAEALNSVEDFLLTVNGDEMYKIDKRIPSFTDMNDGNENFHIVTMPLTDDLDDFVVKAKQKSQNQTYFLSEEEETDELIYFSCLPWLDTTAITNERDLTGNYKDDFIPRVMWGRFTEAGGKKTLNISVEVNHRLIDGYDLGKFALKLTELINSLE